MVFRHMLALVPWHVVESRDPCQLPHQEHRLYVRIIIIFTDNDQEGHLEVRDVIKNWRILPPQTHSLTPGSVPKFDPNQEVRTFAVSPEAAGGKFSIEYNEEKHLKSDF